MIDMITNAAVTLYEPPPVADADGNRTPAAASSLRTRCALDAPTRAQRYTLGSKISDATGVIYIPMGSVLRPEPDGVYTIALDEQPPIRVRVMHVVDRVHSGQSHYEVFARTA